MIRKSTYRKQFTSLAAGILVTLPFICNTQAQSDGDGEEYLMPIKPVRPYEESAERLLRNRWGHGTMIYRDVMNQTFAVSVWGSDKKPKTLTYLNLKSEGETAKLKDEVDVPIDDEFAGAIYDSWRAMLLKTRYPDKLLASNHGWDVEFSAWIQFAGAVYGQGAPVKGFAKELMDFGFELKDYCAASEAKRKAKRDSLIPRLKEFATKVEHSRLY